MGILVRVEACLAVAPGGGVTEHLGVIRLPSTVSSVLLALALIPACGGDDDGGSIYSDTAASASVTATATATASNTSDASASASETTSDMSGSGALLDQGGGDSMSGGGMEEGADPSCAAVDVLYVIDNSPSMYEEQQTLIANFGNFVTDMQTALADVESYHIGVTTSDNYIDEGFLDDSSPTVNASVPECRQIGGLVVEGQQGLCTPFAEGYNFLTEQDALEAEFGCIANVGEDGDSDERVGDALIAATKFGATSGGCNANFIRDDALLIVVMLTDENDSSNASEQEWFDELVAIKGTEENIVMLALVWDESWDGCESSLSESDGWQIIDFAEMFTNHAVGNICENSYAGFFQNAIPTIDSACDMFTPVE